MFESALPKHECRTCAHLLALGFKYTFVQQKKILSSLMRFNSVSFLSLRTDFGLLKRNFTYSGVLIISELLIFSKRFTFVSILNLSFSLPIHFLQEYFFIIFLFLFYYGYPFLLNFLPFFPQFMVHELQNPPY